MLPLRSTLTALGRHASHRSSAAAIGSRRAMSEMSFTFAAPSGVLYKGANIKQVDVPSFSGSFGILPLHVPSLAVLKPGVVTVFEQDGTTNKFFVSSGSVTINEDSSVQILAEEAHPLASIDAEMARKALSLAQSDLSSATSEVAKVEAQIAIEVAEELVKAAAEH